MQIGPAASAGLEPHGLRARARAEQREAGERIGEGASRTRAGSIALAVGEAVHRLAPDARARRPRPPSFHALDGEQPLA